MDIRERKSRNSFQLQDETSSVSTDQTSEKAEVLYVNYIGNGRSLPAKSGTLTIFKTFNIRLFLIFATYWLFLVHTIERWRVKSAMEKCQWENWENWDGDRAMVTPHRVAFIADPQLVDDHTYPKLPRVLNYLIRRMSDNYHYINYKYLQSLLDPDTTIFIGDLFDGGRDWDYAPWLEEYHRFCRIFPENEKRQSIRGLPGNHDIGFQTVSPERCERFASHFGEPNAVYTLGNHTFVQLDTISLSHEDPEVHSAARAFLESCKKLLDPNLPRIVLTHVPLYRDPQVERCGPGRESKKPFPLMRGVEYQTVIDYPISEDILKNLGPSLVFSGDDHDYCDMTHVDYADNTKFLAREISCKTNSMTNGIKSPAVQLLSLNNPQDTEHTFSETYKTTMCYLPSPYFGVKVYAASLVANFAILHALIKSPEIFNRFARGSVVFVSNLSPLERRKTLFIHFGAIFSFFVVLISLYNKM